MLPVPITLQGVKQKHDDDDRPTILAGAFAPMLVVSFLLTLQSIVGLYLVVL